jgi:hypothetical protein
MQMFIRFIFILFGLHFTTAHAQYIGWASTGGGTQTDMAFAIHTQINGASVITGSYAGNAAFGSVNITGNAGRNLFVASYDPSGNVLWVSNASGTGNIEGKGIARDAAGNVYVSGYFSGSVTLGTTTLVSAGNNDIFTAKLNSTGVFQWAVSAGGTSVDEGFAIAVDPIGNVYVTGYFSGTANFSGLSAVAAFYDAFLVKYNTSGVPQWVRKGGGPSTDYGRGVSISPNGNIFWVGDIYGASANFDAIAVTGNGAYDAFISMYDTNGNVLWVRTGGQNLNDRAQAVVADTHGNAYVTGFFNQITTFGPFSTMGFGNQDVFVAKYDALGNILWFQNAGGNLSTNTGNAIAMDDKDFIYVGGTFQNTIQFGNLTMSSLGLDPFVAKYDSSGVPRWLARGGTGQDDECRGIGADSSGRAYFTGWFRGNPAPFGVYPLVSSGLEDVYIARTDSGVLTLNPVNLVYCAGDSIFVPYTVLDDFQPNNTFTAQLSDANGSFANPVTLGQLTGTASSTIAGYLPISTPGGTQYKVRVIANSNPATGRANALTITIKSLPPAPAIATNSPACAGASILLSSGPLANASMNWVGPNGFTSNLDNPVITNASTLHAGVYSVRATVDGCTGDWNQTTVSVVTVPVNITAGDNSPLCAGGQLLFSAQSVTGMNYRWDGPGGFQSALQNPVIPNIQTAQQGLYSVYIYVGPCSSMITTMNVVVNPTPSGVTAGAQQSTLCEFDTLRLTASPVPGATWLWQGPSGFASTLQNPVIPGVSIAQNGIYSLIAYINACSSSVSTVNILVNAAPTTVNTGSNSPVCESDTVFFQAGNATGVTYVWQGPAGFTSNQQSPFIAPAAPMHSGIYTLTLDNGCASSQALIQVQVIPTPNAGQASNDSPICAGDPLSLKVTSVTGANYFWIGPNGFTSTQQNPVITVSNISHAGSYSVYTIVGVCTSIVSVTNAVITSALGIPVLSISGASCEGEPLHLNASGVPGAVYFWSGPGTWVATQQNPIINPASISQSGQYSCYMTLGGCASGTATLSVTVHPTPPKPLISLVADTLWSSAPNNNQWYEQSSGIIAGAVNNWYLPTVSGDYFTIVTANGCPSEPSDTLNYIILGNHTESGFNGLSLYPNPAHQYFMLSGGAAAGIWEVFILDVQGKQVQKITILHEGLSRIDLPESLTKGLYQVRITSQIGVHQFLLSIE